MPLVEAYGKTLEFPDDMSHEDMANVIRKNEHLLNPNYKPPKSSSVREFIQDNILGFDISRKPSIAEQAEATADEGVNTAASEVKGAPVRQSFYNKALLNNDIGSQESSGVFARTRKAADEDTKGQDFQRELEGLRTDGNIQESPSGVTGLLGNVITGAKQTGRMAAATVSALANDNKEVEGIAKESNLSSEENTPTEQKALLGDLRKINREQDAFDQISDTLKSAANNPMGTGQMVAEQLPNTAVSLASGFAGFKAGGAAGAVFGPIGATIGGTLGFVSGMFLGNVLLEAGGKAIEKASDEDGFTPEDRDSALREGAVKAGVITGVDAATFKLGGMLARKIGASAINAGARAEAKVLIDAGVDATSLSAINAALKSSPELLKAAKVAGERAALQSLSTGRKAAILGTGAALETVGEFVGEAGGEYAATGKADYVDATIEALSSATMSIAETAYNYNKVASGNDLSPVGIQKAVNSINDAETKSKINDIRNAATVDQAINVANESVSQKPVDKDDVLRVADPTLADIERLTGLKPSETLQTAQEELQRQSQAAQQNIATGSDIEPSQTLRKTASWVIVDKNNNEALFETYDKNKVDALNTERYKAVPILEYLQGLNKNNKGGQPSGSDIEIVLPDNKTLKARWDVVDADNVKASLKNGVSQPRDRTRAASDVQIQEIANQPDYRRLADSPVMDIGAPVISNDGQIVGGNGRFEALSRAYDQGTHKDYLERLKQDAINKGIDPAILDTMRKPVLVRRISEPFDTRQLAIASNSGMSAAYSDLEQAKIDAERLKGIDEIITADNGDIVMTGDNVRRVRDALGGYNAAEIASFVDDKGQLSQQGIKRIRNAMLAKAYGDNPVLGKIIESTDSDIKTILGSLTRVAGDVVKARSTAPKESDITPNLLDAINIFSQLKQKGQSVTSYLSQQDAFTEQLDPVTENVLLFLDKNSRSQPKVTQYIRDAYTKQGAIDATSPDIFGQEPPKVKDIFAKPTIEEELEKHLKKNGYNFDVRPIDQRDINALDDTKKAQKDIAEKQAKIFNKKIIFVKAKGEFGINGVMVPAIKDTIFINIETPKPFHAVMAHELSHWMEQEHPSVYKDMLGSLKDVIVNEEGYRKKYGITEQDEGLIQKEIAADLMGDNFTDETFWNKVAAANPDKWKEIANRIVQWLKNAILKAKSRGMGSEDWVTDAKKAQDIIANAVAQYTKQQDAVGDDVRFNVTGKNKNAVNKTIKMLVDLSNMRDDVIRKIDEKNITASEFRKFGDASLKASNDIAEMLESGDINGVGIDGKLLISKNTFGNNNWRVTFFSPSDGNPSGHSEYKTAKQAVVGTNLIVSPSDQKKITAFSRAFHGSPHDHNKFDSSKIGTGEGAQAYGYGHYFTDSKEVAEWYKDKFEQRDSSWVGGDLLLYDRDYVSLALQKGYSVAEFKNNQEKLISPLIEPKKALKVFKEFNRGGIPKTKSKLYEVELAPEQDEYLLWDKPLSEQSEKVRNALKNISVPDKNMSGKEIYSYVKELEANKSGETGTAPAFYNSFSKAASEYLHSLGIRGIKYLDGSSRAKGEGAYNYVIFDDKDIEIKAKFSKQEQEKTLLAHHNLTSDNLIHADKMGGLIAPSIAISNKNNPLSGFGEITLIADQDIVDPKKGAKVFGSDIYSPRYPEITYVFDKKSLKSLNDLISEGKKAVDEHDIYESTISSRELKDFANSPAVVYQFLKQNNIDPDIKLYGDFNIDDKLKPFADTKMDAFDLSKDVGFKNTVKEIFDGNDENGYVARAYANDVVKYREHQNKKGKVNREDTRYSLGEQVRKNNLSDDLEKYAIGLIQSSEPKEKIFQGYTNSGNRRYIDHSIDNVLKLLKKELRGGESFNYGLGSVRSKYSPQFKSVSDIKQNEYRLMPPEKFGVEKEKIKNKFNDLDSKFSEYATFSGSDNFSNALMDVPKMGISKAFKENGFENVPDKLKLEVEKFITELRGMPTEYFEVKQLKAMPISDFSAAVIPDNAPQKVNEILSKNGITDIREYKSGNNNDRVEKIKQFEKLMFSRSELPETLNIDGTERPTRNSEGKLIHPTEEGIRNFWKWFGDGYLTDVNGRPSILYHQTSIESSDNIYKEGFRIDKPRARKSDPRVVDGIFFKPSPDNIGLGSSNENDIDQIPVYLNIKNPLVANTAEEVGDIVNDKIYLGLLRDVEIADANLAKEFDDKWKSKNLDRVKFKEFTEEFFPRSNSIINDLAGKARERLTEVVSNKGYDGVIIISDKGSFGRTTRTIIALNPNQIKSAIENNGEFSESSNDIRFSQQKPFNPNEDIPETKFQKAQRVGQDKFNRFRVIKEWLAKEKGINLSEAADVYGAETRYYGKVANQQEDFRNKVRNPLIEKVSKAGFKLEDVEQYLKIRHAQEANTQNRKLTGRNDSMAFGISDKQAQEYLNKAPKELAKIADEFQSLTEKAQQLRLDNGIENQERVDAMRSVYKYYVPVRGDAESQQKQNQYKGTGKGFSMKYKPKRRLGHELRNESVIENIFQDYERAIMQVEKNRIGKSLALMAAEIQMPELISINQPVKRKVLRNEKAYGVLVKGELQDVFQTEEAAKQNRQLLVATDKKLTLSDVTIAPITDQRLVYSASPMLADNEVLVYMDGHEVRLQINDELLARAYKNMGTEPLGHILSTGRAINGWMSKAYTGYNPEFILTNIMRDFQSGIINLTGEQGILIAAKAVANYPKSFSSLLKYAFTGESNKWIDAYRDNGGNTGAAYLPDLERLGEEVKREYAAYQGIVANLKEGDSSNALRAAGKKTFNATLKYIEHLNAAGENAFRLATFKAMVDSGKSVSEAASMAKNVTVNFNRKGEMGAELNALYLFFNASLQGSAATSHALFKGRHKFQAWGLAAGMVSIGYIMASMLGGFDDEDKYDEIGDGAKSRNLIMSYGNGYLKIPVPYGYGFFYNTGRMIAEAQRKDEVGKLPYQLAALAIEEFSPFNVASTEDSEFSSKKVFYGLLPTMLKIPAEITNNYSSFTNRELYPEKSWYKSEPDNEKMWRGTNGTVYDVSAQYLASAGIEISPEVLKYAVRTATGGAGAFIDSTVSAAMLKKQGAELDTREIPFVRKFYGEATIQDARARYNKAKEEAREAYEKFNALRKKNDLVSVRNYLNDKKELIALNSYANKMSDVIKNIRDQQDLIKLSEDFTVAEKRLKIKELEKQEEYYYDLFLNRHKQVKGR